MRRIILLLFIAVLACAADVLAGAPKLTLLYSANTEGEVRPCPT